MAEKETTSNSPSLSSLANTPAVVSIVLEDDVTPQTAESTSTPVSTSLQPLLEFDSALGLYKMNYPPSTASLPKTKGRRRNVTLADATPKNGRKPRPRKIVVEGDKENLPSLVSAEDDANGQNETVVAQPRPKRARKRKITEVGETLTSCETPEVVSPSQTTVSQNNRRATRSSAKKAKVLAKSPIADEGNGTPINEEKKKRGRGGKRVTGGKPMAALRAFMMEKSPSRSPNSDKNEDGGVNVNSDIPQATDAIVEKLEEKEEMSATVTQIQNETESIFPFEPSLQSLLESISDIDFNFLEKAAEELYPNVEENVTSNGLDTPKCDSSRALQLPNDPKVVGESSHESFNYQGYLLSQIHADGKTVHKWNDFNGNEMELSSMPGPPPPTPVTPATQTEMVVINDVNVNSAFTFNVNDPLVNEIGSDENLSTINFGDLDNLIDQNEEYVQKVYNCNPWYQYILMDNNVTTEQTQQGIDLEVHTTEVQTNNESLDQYLKTMNLIPVLDPEEIKTVLGIDLEMPATTQYQCPWCSVGYGSFDECQEHMNGCALISV